MEIFQIDENLYQSSMIDDASRVKMFDVCIDLSGNIDLGANDFKIYLKWTIEDKEVPDLIILNAVAAFGREIAFGKEMSASGGSAVGRKVLVHCDQGINRSSLVNGIILHMNGMKGGQKIIDYIRSKRPNALTNPNFINYLKNLK